MVWDGVFTAQLCPYDDYSCDGAAGWLTHFPAVWTWTGNSASSLCLSLLLCRMGAILVPDSQGDCEV